MRLVHQDPHHFVGRTIIYRSRFWLVDSVDGTDIVLQDHVRNERGRLRRHQWRACSVFPSAFEVRSRYPRMLALLRSTCLLTSGEAESLLIGYLTTGSAFMGSEAVARIGGAFNALNRALLHRMRARQELRRYERLMAASVSN